MKASGVAFQDTIDTYYDLVDKRLPNHGENLDELRRLRILIDGATHQGAPNELLLQIFTQTVIGPIFFEIIQRKGDQGFGEGNFRALFESIELDQIRRGVLKDTRARHERHGQARRQGASTRAWHRSPTARATDRRAATMPARAADYTCDQHWERYTAPSSMTLYRRLYERQAAQLPGLACDEFIEAVQHLGDPTQIPRFDELSTALHKATALAGRGRAGADPRRGLLRACSRSASFPSPNGCAAPRSSTTSSSPTYSTTCSVMCRCSSTRCSPTTCRPMARAA